MPRSLTGRLALVLALALLVAQGVNFILLARAGERLAATRAASAAVVPIVIALEGRDAETLRSARRARFVARRTWTSEAPEPGQRLRRIEAALSDALSDRGREATNLRVVEGTLESSSGPREGLIVSVLTADGTWLNASAPAPRRRPFRLLPLLLQTGILYLALLVPVLWIGREVARPLAELTDAARSYRVGEPALVPPAKAPDDVAALARALAAMQARIADSLRERDAMLGAIGHDLRTPLTSLRLRVEQVGDAAMREKMAATIRRTETLLDDTLALATLGRPAGEAAPVDLAEIARGAAEAARAAGQNVTLGALETIGATVHAEAMTRALANLIANADRYAGGGTVSVRREGDEAVIAVTDAGPGLPEGFTPGEAFARGEGSRNRATGGTGLGLAIARRVAEAHGGRLDLASRPGKGLVAAILVPLKEGRANALYPPFKKPFSSR